LLPANAVLHSSLQEKTMLAKDVLKPLAVAAGLALALPVAAQSARDDAPHFYAGGSVGQNDHEEMSWGAFGGYQVNRWLGAEFGYKDLGRQVIGGTTIDASAWELVGVGRIPIFDRFAAYGKLGGYMGRAHGGGVNENTTDLTYGAGLEYGFTPNVAVRGEWQRYRELGGGGFGANSDLDVASVSVLYRFR
jgi:OOP family OmpA-OmpF porin